MNDVVAYLRAIHPVPQESLQKLEACFNPVEFKRKQVITREGQVEKYLYFVVDGLQRSYYIKEGKEHVIAFTYAPSFSGSMQGLS